MSKHNPLHNGAKREKQANKIRTKSLHLVKVPCQETDHEEI